MYIPILEHFLLRTIEFLLMINIYATFGESYYRRKMTYLETSPI